MQSDSIKVEYRDIPDFPGYRVGDDGKVQILVMLAFAGPPPKGHVSCHNNGDKNDNSYANLRYDTPKANEADKKKHGTQACGERQGHSKLKADQVQEIRRLWITGKYTQKAIGAMYGVTKHPIQSILAGKSWKHLPCESRQGAD